ncbi:MAG TPA: PP2C family protein-serine/threonine phosphatase [Thermoanaerobaculia bacterium]|nr:PP2C family protein-serine/threonine phosphatase [Thermoanaerobaculia bacterium]
MDPTYSLDDVARTTEEAAVRRRFDQRNLFWSFLLLIFFAVTILPMLGISRRSGSMLEPLLLIADFALVAFGLLVARDAWRIDRGDRRGGHWRAGRWVRDRISATLLTWIGIQYVVILIALRHSSDWIPWVMIFPWLLIGIRMGTAELVLIHVFFTAGAMGMTLLGFAPRAASMTGVLIGGTLQNAFVLTISLVASRRLRRQVTREWGERRSQALEQIRMRDELRYAREMQLSMLPECAPPLEWADLCAVSIPATEVGGDYYDYFVDGDRVALVCGDVAGHGMASGLVLSALRSGFTLLRDSLHNPAAVLQRLHDLVAQTSRRRMLVTVTVVLLDHATRRATIASAGHPPVVLRHADGSVEAIELFAPPLGVRLPVAIPQRQMDVHSGDVFVLHSDGIYETRNESDESYGLERLIEIVRHHGDGNAESLRDAIVADVERFRGSVLPDDDVTVVVARVA